MGLVATMSALVLGLLVASAKNSYDEQGTEMTELASRIVLLDRIFAHYGPETKEVRTQLKGLVAGMVTHFEGRDGSGATDVQAPTVRGELPVNELQALVPKTEAQRALQAEALNIILELSKDRWLMYEQRTRAMSTPLLVIVVAWLSIIFMSFGLYATPNATVTVALGIAALTVSTAIFLIVEMYSPYSGLIRISVTPLRSALALLGS